MAAYSYNTANAGSYGAQDMKPQRKKKPGIAQAPYGQPAPVAGGPTQNVGGGAGTLGNPYGSAKPMPTGGTSIRPGSGAPTMPGPATSVGGSLGGGMTFADLYGVGEQPPGGGTSRDESQLGVTTPGQGSEDANDQALMDVINELLTEGPRSTEEIEGVIGEQYDRSLQDELGRVMAAAGAGGMGSSGQLGYGMADAARANALDRSGAILGAQTDAEKAWLDQINAAGNLYGTDLEIRSMDDYYRLMEQILAGEGEPEPGTGPTNDDPLEMNEDGSSVVGFHPAPGTDYIYSGGFDIPGNAEIIDDEYEGADGNTYVVWKDPATGKTYISTKPRGGPGGYGWLPSPQGADASYQSGAEWLKGFK